MDSFTKELLISSVLSHFNCILGLSAWGLLIITGGPISVWKCFCHSISFSHFHTTYFNFQCDETQSKCCGFFLFFFLPPGGKLCNLGNRKDEDGKGKVAYRRKKKLKVLK